MEDFSKPSWNHGKRQEESFVMGKCTICEQKEAKYCRTCLKLLVVEAVKRFIKRKPPRYILSHGRSTVEKGSRFEVEIVRFLERHGWIVFRCHRSRPLDLIAYRSGKVYFIECKSHAVLFHEEWSRLQKLSRRLNQPIMNVFKDIDGNLKVRVIGPHSWLLKTIDKLLRGEL